MIPEEIPEGLILAAEMAYPEGEEEEGTYHRESGTLICPQTAPLFLHWVFAILSAIWPCKPSIPNL